MCTTIEADGAGRARLPNYVAETLYYTDAPLLLAGPATRSPFEHLGGPVRFGVVALPGNRHSTGGVMPYAKHLAGALKAEIVVLSERGDVNDREGVVSAPEERKKSEPAGGDGRGRLVEDDWPIRQGPRRDAGVPPRVTAQPTGMLRPVKIQATRGDIVDLVIIARPESMAEQGRVVTELAEILRSGSIPVLIVP
jgi:hypothetical protein